jgi:hypothetical protein
MRTDQAPLHGLQKVGRDVLCHRRGGDKDREEKKEAGNPSGKTLNLCVVHSDFWWLLLTALTWFRSGV